MGSRSGGPGDGAGAGERMQEPRGGTEERWQERKKQIVVPVPLCKPEAQRRHMWGKKLVVGNGEPGADLCSGSCWLCGKQ